MSQDLDLPSVSVIVLNYNGQEHLETCFRSLQGLDYPVDRLELMLVDNASTDGSVEFMRTHFPGVTLICNEHNYGFSKGNNIGARQASGEYVAFLNNDMRVDSLWLRELVKPLLHDPQVACAGSKILTWDGRHVDFGGVAANFYGYGFQIGWGQPAAACDEDKAILHACGGAMLIRRPVFLDAGGFDEDFFAYYEDLDLGWRLWVLGYQVVYAAQSRAYHVHHGYWKREPDEKKRLLYERNALSTVIKNYEEQNLQRILPVALMLLLRRAFLVADIDPRPYRSEPLAAFPGLYQEARTTPTAASRYTGRYYVGEAWRTLRRDGPGSLVSKTRAELLRRAAILRARWQRASGQRAPATPGQSVEVPRNTLSYLLAANDVVAWYGKLLEKRARIQAARRRSDTEILRLFGMPLEVCFFDPRYEQTQWELVRAFGIDQLFGMEQSV